jgi:hypothetical protein
MLPAALALAITYTLAVVGLTAFGFALTRIAGDPAGPALGLIVGVLSATAWAVSTIADAEWNVRLNLFAALFAACSLGFLAPGERLCSWHQLPMLCR